MTVNKQDIKRLTPHSHVRCRTEMYLGSRGVNTQNVLLHTDNGPLITPVSWVPALFTSVREVLDNCLDELTKGKIKNGTIKISYNPDCMLFTIEDNGRGIPIDWDGPEGMHKVTMALTELMAGDNFDDTERKGTAGMNGVGGSTVAHVSSFFNVTVVRKGRPYNDYIDPAKDYTDDELDLIEINAARNEYTGFYEFSQSYSEGGRDARDRDVLEIDEPSIKLTENKQTGTHIEFALSSDVFKSLTLPELFVASLVKEIAAVNPHLKIYFNDKLVQIKQTVIKTLFPKVTSVIECNINNVGFKADFYVIPNQVEDGTMQHGLVNNIPMFDGGQHIKAFKEKFALGLIKALGKESKRRKLYPNRGDVEEGVLMYHVTRMDSPFFNGQAKTQLINDEVYKIVESAMDEEYFDSILRKHKDWIADIYTRTASRTNKKDMDEVTRDAKKNLRKKVAKLSDAGFAGKAIVKHDTILFVTEGDSANNMSSVRNTDLHGTLPLRGKILNVSADKIGPKEIVASMSTADIMNALGLIPGEKAVRSKLRYGQICIATDMDHDGANIAGLVVNFLFTYWPELFEDKENPFVTLFMTPFLIITKKKQREYFYLHDVDQFDPSDWKGWHVRRAKGLGTLETVDWKNSFNELKVIPVYSDEYLADTLEVIFSKTKGAADIRKNWMRGEL